MGDRTQTVIKNGDGHDHQDKSATFDELARILTSIGAASQTASSPMTRTTIGYP